MADMIDLGEVARLKRDFEKRMKEAEERVTRAEADAADMRREVASTRATKDLLRMQVEELKLNLTSWKKMVGEAERNLTELALRLDDQS